MNVITGNVALQNVFKAVYFVDMRSDADEPERRWRYGRKLIQHVFASVARFPAALSLHP
jgi:hypothetical protein